MEPSLGEQFRVRIHNLRQRIPVLQTAVSERIASGEKFDSAEVIARIQKLALDAERLAARQEAGESELQALEAREAVVAAMFKKR